MTRPRPRDVVAAIGVVAGVVGFLMVVRPALAASITVPRLGLIVMGVLAVIEGLRSFQSRRSADIEGAEPPDPEERVSTPLPGEEFDERVARVSQWRRGRYTADYQRLRGRLHDAAVEAITSRERIPREEAETRVEAGAWTDDPAAAAFLGGSEAPQPPWQLRLRAALAGSRIGFYVARTVNAIAAVREAR